MAAGASSITWSARPESAPRFWRSLKYEEIYLHEYQSVGDLRRAVSAWLTHDNIDRPHWALDYQVPWQGYTTGLAKRPCSGQGRQQGGGSPLPVTTGPLYVCGARKGRLGSKRQVVQ
jgi:hypothetical protein